MSFAIVRLMSNAGVSGPTGRIEYACENDARRWAAGQVGHPWDVVTVEIYEDEDDANSMGDPSNTLEIELVS